MKHILTLILLLFAFSAISQTNDIGGTVLSCTGNEVTSSYTIQLRNAAGDVIQESHESPFLFENLPAGEKYTISATASQLNPLNGVTTFDGVLISQSILGANSFTTICQQIAADLSGSGSVSTIDLVFLRRLVLNIDQELQVPNKILPTVVAMQPIGSTNLEDEIVIEELTEDVLDANFTFIKIGNLN